MLLRDENEEKRERIREMNRYNNELLCGLRLFSAKKGSFPDKFSQNLQDIYRTCQIQNILLREIILIKQDQDKNRKLNNVFKNQKDVQIQSLNVRIGQKQKTIRDLVNQIEKLKKQEKIITNLKTKIKQLETINRYSHQKAQQLQREKNKCYIRISELSEQKHQELKRFNWGKTIEIMADSNTKIVNTQYKKLQIDRRDQFQQFLNDQNSSQLNFLNNQNKTLKNWLNNFIKSIEKIVHYRIDRLKEINSDYNHIVQDYLPIINVENIGNFLQQFPYTELLQDFQLVMNESEYNRLQKERLLSLNKSDIINKEIVQLIISQLRNFKSAAIEEFKKCGDKRQEIAKSYQEIVQVDENCLELLRQVTFEKLRKFRIQPERILAEIQKEQMDIKKYQQILQANSQFMKSKVSEFLNDRIRIQEVIKAIIVQYSDQEDILKNEQYCRIGKEELKQKKQLINVQYFDENSSQEKRKEIIDVLFIKLAKKYILESVVKLSSEAINIKPQSCTNIKDSNNIFRKRTVDNVPPPKQRHKFINNQTLPQPFYLQKSSIPINQYSNNQSKQKTQTHNQFDQNKEWEI